MFEALAFTLHVVLEKDPMKKLYVVGLLLIIHPAVSFCQTTDSLIKKLDSVSKVESDTGKNGHNNISQENYNEVTKLTGKTYLILLASDIKQEFSAPFHIKQKDYVKVGGFIMITAGLMIVDESINRYAMKLHENSPPVVKVSNYVTRFGGSYEVYTLAALGAYGWAFKNEKIKTTTLLATQAYICGSLLETLKFVFGRQRPNYVDPKTHENDPSWHGPLFAFHKNVDGVRPPVNSYSSFPSGHSILAFAAATVFAMEYRDRPLVPVLAYSAASLIGLSRITENRHWSSDIFAGATLGYLCGKLVVNNYHRYNKVQKQNHPTSVTLVSLNGKILPGIIYTL